MDMDLKSFMLFTIILINETSTSLANVIFSNNINDTEILHNLSTKTNSSGRAVNGSLIFGLSNGEITRCDVGDLNKCTRIYEQRFDSEYFSPVVSLAPYEEYLYLGLESGEIRRCLLTDKVEHCTTFHKSVSEIYALDIEDDVLYAASSDGVLHCHLHKHGNCATLIDDISPVYSLLVNDSDLLIGSEEMLLRCLVSLTRKVSSSDCYVFAKVGSAVISLARHDIFIYAGTTDGEILSCEFDSSTCVTMFKTHSQIKALNVHGSSLHAASSGNLIHCNLSKKSSSNSSTNACTAKERHEEDILSITSVYNTIPMVYYFENEDKTCSWQGRKCPPYIIYYDEKDRSPLELKVRNGKLYFANRLFNTSYADFSHSGPKAIFVMDATGRIFVSNQHPFLLLHHSSLVAGHYVASAGEISAINGEIKTITTCSGHYRPSYEIGKQVVASLKAKGYDKYIKLVDCSKLRLMIDLEYNKLDLYYKVLFNNVTVADVVYKDGFENEN